MANATNAQLAEQHLQSVLHKLAGPDATPRDDQLDAVAAVIQPRSRVLVVQATGWGKSAVYWAATAAIRAQGLGPTLVVSPLLALMDNQVAAATRAGLVAATMNSTNIDDWDAIFSSFDADMLDVLLVSPERLANPKFAGKLDELMARVGLVVIDEAHCISDWGFDFRPDYRRLSQAILSAPEASVLATTATANQRVTNDVAHQLGDNTITFRGTLARTSLQLSVVPGLTPLERYAWVDQALNQLDGSGIVYVLTVAEAHRLTEFLQSQGHDVEGYTGGMEWDDRLRIQDLLQQNRIKAVIATSALGMGYDKPDLGFCIHVGSPASPVAYYQQVGRAGRSLDRADAILLPSEADEPIWEYFATASIPKLEDVEVVLSALATGPQSVPELETSTTLRRGRLETLVKILAIEGCLDKVGSKWRLTDTPYVHDQAKWDELRAVRAAEADLMRRYAAGAGCLMAFLQEALDDPSPQPCGRCSVCTGNLPAGTGAPEKDSVIAARNFVRGVDVVLEPRKKWPPGSGRKGFIAGVAEGRVVAFADDPGWQEEIAEFNRSGRTRIPQALLDGAVPVLTRWRPHWATRPVAVVPCAAPGARFRANQELAAHIAAVGKLPVLDVFVWSGDAPSDDLASAPMVDHLLGAISLRGGMEIPREPVLLVSATARSRWILTVAGSLLRDAGCAEVFPLVIHQRP
jgi:ATP-dependent DNA helicase RecQ